MRPHARSDRGDDLFIGDGGDIAVALQPGFVLVDAAGDIDREDELEVDRQLGRESRRDEQAVRGNRGQKDGKTSAHAAHVNLPYASITSTTSPAGVMQAAASRPPNPHPASRLTVNRPISTPSCNGSNPCTTRR